MLLLDTDVLIDVLRGHRSAVEWLSSTAPETEHIGVPGLAIMELIQGCRNQLEVKRVQRFSQQFISYWPTATDCERALDTFGRLRPTHGASLIDVLIAETAIGLQAQLATFNVKHYAPISSLTTAAPYSR